MKKLYVIFILLVAFLVFAPCFTFADLARMPSPEEIAWQQKELQLMKEQNKKDLQCVLKKKANLPGEYKGPNLEIETPRIKIITTPKVETINPQRLLMEDVETSSTKNIYYVDTFSHVFSNWFDKSDRPVFGLRIKSGFAYDCKEYIILRSRKFVEEGKFKVERDISSIYDVTDVPPGSYLKFIPKTEEFQVLPPTAESYKEIIKSQEERLAARNERLKAEPIQKIKLDESEKLDDKANKYWKERIEDSLCLWEKKSNLPKEYKGPNLKFGPINSCYRFTYHSIPINLPRFDYLTNIKLENKDLRNMIHDYVEREHKHMTSRDDYINDASSSRRHFKVHKTLPQKHTVRNSICGCNDYITVDYGYDNTAYGYDITNVPLGSYLKFIPETKELQVISPTDNAYEKILKDQTEPLDLAYYNFYFGNLNANRAEIIRLTKESYKDFVEKEQSKLQNEELKSELKKYAAKLEKN